MVFIFVTRLRFPSRLSIAEVFRKRYGDQTLKLVRKFEKTDIKHRKALLDLQFSKIREDHSVIPKFLRCQRKLLREEIYNKRLVVSKLDKESKLLYNNVKSNLNLNAFIMF